MHIKLKTLTFSLLALGFSTSILAKPIWVKSYNQIEEYKLDNGLKIILFENNKQNKVFMNMVYQTGSLNDPKGKGGLAHLLEHLAFKGTENIKGEKFQSLLEQYTLSNNASTDYYVTQYTNEIRPEQKSINEVLRLEAERMDKLVLQKKFVPSEIEIVKRERELRLDQPFSLLIDDIFKAIYGNQDLGRAPIGDLAELQSINMDELNHFYKTWYAPNNATIIVSGKFDKASVLKSIDKQFSSIPARQIPNQPIVPTIDLTQIKNKKFSIQKGSSYQKMNIYLTPRNPKNEPVLTVAPFLFTIEPSGQLYRNLVDTGITDDTALSPWNSQDFNLIIASADYVPSQNVKKVDKTLIANIEAFENFDDKELNRIKTVFKNAQDSDYKDASRMGEILSESVALNKGNWIQYFKDREVIQQLSVDDVNKKLRTYFKKEHRITSEITPTSEADKKAMTLNNDLPPQSLAEDSAEKIEPFKNIAVYKKDSVGYLKSIRTSLTQAESVIQRGNLSNGLQFSLYPTQTLDDQTYANIVVNFGTSESLLNQKEIIDFTAYLLLRGSEKYSLQDIADKSIEADGEVLVIPHGNSIELKVVADKAHFADYLDFVLDVVRTPLFEKQQFDLIKMKSLNRLDRSFTEPETVATFALNKLVNQYSEDDLRGFSTPKHTKKFINKASNEQVKQFYNHYFNMSNAQVSVTGDINPQKIKGILNHHLANWSGQENYDAIGTVYKPVQAQKHHLLAEQREFGNYRANLAIAMGAESEDIAAMNVFSYLLGESQISSRLGRELREKNTLVYGFNQSLTVDDYENSGFIEIQANYTAGKSELVSQAVKKVLSDLLEHGVTEQEVEAAKGDILKSSSTSFKNAMTINELLTPQLKHKRDLSYVLNRYDNISKVTKADVDALIKKYIKLDQFVEVMADQYGKKAK